MEIIIGCVFTDFLYGDQLPPASACSVVQGSFESYSAFREYKEFRIQGL